MKIVIDIPEEVKHNVYAYGLSLCPNDKEQLIKAIKNGTPLPNNHGRLIDGDALLDTDRLIVDSMKCHYIPMMDIYDAPTIIEADKD